MRRKKNPKEAIRYWQESANQKFTWAYANLGLAYATGTGVEKDLNKAVEYWTLAAKDNHIDALRNLSLAYEEGIGGLKKDKQKAKELMSKANALVKKNTKAK